MVTVEKYIRKLLFEYDCVIIPEFGGLLTHHVGAHYDTTNAVFLPSTKRIAFNEVLRIDDGLLAYYISVNEKVVRDDAYFLIKKYVESLRSQLREGQTVSLNGIGSFSANSEGKPVFEPDYSQNFSCDWYGLEGVDVQLFDHDRIQNLSIIESGIAIEAEETAPSIVRPINKSRNWFGWAAAAVVSGTILASSILYKPLDNSLLSTLNPVYGVKELYVSAISNFQITRDAKTTPPVPSLKPTPQPTVFVPLLPVENSEVVLVETKTEEIIPQKNTKISKPVNAEPAITYSGKYFLIAGSFEKMKNARVLKKQLLRNGFIDAQVLDNAEGRLIKVSVGAYQSMTQAMEDKDKVDEITGADSWVYKKK